MKIAFFSDNFYPELSGISDSIRTTADILSSHGHEIHFFVPRYSKKNYHYAGLSVQELQVAPGQYVHRLSSLPFPGPTGQSRLVIPRWRTIKLLRQLDVDAIHTHSFFGAGLTALWTARQLRLPLIGTNHTAIGEYIRHSPLRLRLFETWAKKMVAWYYNHCCLVTAPSQIVINELRDYHFNKPTQVLPNPIKTNIFK